jgi:hypothetical protein
MDQYATLLLSALCLAFPRVVFGFCVDVVSIGLA